MLSNKSNTMMMFYSQSDLGRLKVILISDMITAIWYYVIIMCKCEAIPINHLYTTNTMYRISTKNKIIISSLIVLSFLSVALSTISSSNAFLGFNPYPSQDQSIRSSQSTLPGSHCYSPNASIINSCNSGDGTQRDNIGQNLIWWFLYFFNLQ